jgi:allophanate hydrolase subunit 1
VRLLPYGPSAALVECASGDEARRAAAELRRWAPAGVSEVVPGARTVLIEGADAAAVARELAGRHLTSAGRGGVGDVTLAVRWDGADLEWVASYAGTTVAEVVTALEAAELVVAFSGFAPGFGYLSGLPEMLHVPRLDEPRTRVPAGSVALAGSYAGIYPCASPGGWRLVGTTSASLWDAERDPPALLAPGTRVRLVGEGRR